MSYKDNPPVWRVAEFRSSSNPDRKVLMIAEGEAEIAAWEKRGDFKRWMDNDQLRTVREALTVALGRVEDLERQLYAAKLQDKNSGIEEAAKFLDLHSENFQKTGHQRQALVTHRIAVAVRLLKEPK